MCDQILQKTSKNDNSFHLQYLDLKSSIDKQLDEKEAKEEEESGMISYPKPNDVLIGRGGGYQEHPGSQYFDKLIYERFEEYFLIDNKFQKSPIIMEIIQTIKDSGGRFLQRTPAGWEILDDVVVRDKTASAFRNRSTYKKAAEVLPPHLAQPVKRRKLCLA